MVKDDDMKRVMRQAGEVLEELCCFPLTTTYGTIPRAVASFRAILCEITQFMIYFTKNSTVPK